MSCPVPVRNEKNNPANQPRRRGDKLKRSAIIRAACDCIASNTEHPILPTADPCTIPEWAILKPLPQNESSRTPPPLPKFQKQRSWYQGEVGCLSPPCQGRSIKTPVMKRNGGYPNPVKWTELQRLHSEQLPLSTKKTISYKHSNRLKPCKDTQTAVSKEQLVQSVYYM